MQAGPAPHSRPCCLDFTSSGLMGGCNPQTMGVKKDMGKTHRERRARRPSDTIFKREELLRRTFPERHPTFDAFSLHSNVSLKKERLIYVTRSVSLSQRQNILIPRHLLVIASISEDFDKIKRLKSRRLECLVRAERDEMFPFHSLRLTQPSSGANKRRVINVGATIVKIYL